MNVILYIILLTCCLTLVSCELLTTMAGAVGLSSLGVYYYQYLHCKYHECCNDDYIYLDLQSKYTYYLFLQIIKITLRKVLYFDLPICIIFFRT